MDEDSYSPPEIMSFQAIQVLDNNLTDLNKKRKLEIEQLDLPSPKHKCQDYGRGTPLFLTSKDKSPGKIFEHLPKNKVDLKKDNGSSREESESQYDSAKGSNSFTEDGDSSTSIHGEICFESKYKKSDDRPSTSTASTECAVSLENKYHSVGLSHHGEDKGKSIVEIGEGSAHHIGEELQLCESIEEHLLEFGCHLGFGNSELGNDCLEHTPDKEVEGFFGRGQGNYVLSSGRWNTNEGAETQSVPRKPTIDQEFEEYFSSLMM